MLSKNPEYDKKGHHELEMAKRLSKASQQIYLIAVCQCWVGNVWGRLCSYLLSIIKIKILFN